SLSVLHGRTCRCPPVGAGTVGPARGQPLGESCGSRRLACNKAADPQVPVTKRWGASRANSIRRTCIAALLAFSAALALAPGAQAATDDKIIVSGASGQLGALTVKELLARGVPA